MIQLVHVEEVKEDIKEKKKKKEKEEEEEEEEKVDDDEEEESTQKAKSRWVSKVKVCLQFNLYQSESLAPSDTQKHCLGVT